MALGSYARSELCPGSDVDAMLLHGGDRHDRPPAEALWYPFWDAGFDLGHSTRTVREAMTAADADVDSLTALLDARHVAGDVELTNKLLDSVRRLAVKRRRRLLSQLIDGAHERARSPGPIAEMLEPDLKEGLGGLRDVQAPTWAGWTLGTPGGTEAMVGDGYLEPSDPSKLEGARELLLEVRVALQRATGGSSNRLHLQDQDAVAAAVGVPDADELVAELAEAARAVVWITGEAWDRLASAQRGPLGRLGRRDRDLGNGIVLRDRRIALVRDAEVDGSLVLEVAAAAVEHDAPIDRAALERLEGASRPVWGPDDRTAFLRVLAGGRRALPVFEALDHYGLLVEVLPEWRRVRSRPQRNAYHRFTIDRHLLEAVAECAELLRARSDDAVPADPVDTEAVRTVRRPELLLLAALLHDIGKGGSGDHSERGAYLATRVCRRIGLDVAGTATVVWLVLHHLLLAEVATRRDLSEETTIARVANAAGNLNRLRLLYLLTLGDSRATGPAAWGPVKAALVRQLYAKAAALLARGDAGTEEGAARRAQLAALIGEPEASAHLDALPPSYAVVFEAQTMERHRALLAAPGVQLESHSRDDGRLECTVVAPDRPGLLATVAGVLTICGFDVRQTSGFSRDDGVALEVFTGVDHFGRLATPEGVEHARRLLEQALAGQIDLQRRVGDHVERYRRPGPEDRTEVSVEIDLDASDFATVVEVHAADEIGLLYRIAAELDELGLDVTVAKVATLGADVVDSFYVRDPVFGKVTDPETLAHIRDELERVVEAATADVDA